MGTFLIGFAFLTGAPKGREASISKSKTETTLPLPLLSIDAICKQPLPTTPVRIRGVVTGIFRNRLYLRDETGSIRVLKAVEKKYQAGDQVEIEGEVIESISRREFSANHLTLLGKGSPPPPVALMGEPLHVEDYEAELISLEVEYLGYTESKVLIVLHCRTKNQYIDARLNKPCELPSKLVPYSTVKLTGHCELQSYFSSTQPKQIDFLYLNLSGLESIEIIRQAHWWSSRILLGSVAAAMSAGLIIFTWIGLLRRQVNRQTRIIAEQIENSATLTERHRIARDLHDEIEQEMTGIAFQLENVEANILEAPKKAHSALQLARQMLKHCREETRNTIRDLRGDLLQKNPLPEAMKNRLLVLTAESATPLLFEVKGEPTSLDAVTETHFLRLAQESVTNAIRHASPTEIRVELLYTADTIRLTVQDNGSGFDTMISPSPGHFGLSGMHERAGKMNAQIQIESTPEQGTIVQVTRSLS